jgi:hypothetical protein
MSCPNAIAVAQSPAGPAQLITHNRVSSRRCESAIHRPCDQVAIPKRTVDLLVRRCDHSTGGLQVRSVFYQISTNAARSRCRTYSTSKMQLSYATPSKVKSPFAFHGSRPQSRSKWSVARVLLHRRATSICIMIHGSPENPIIFLHFVLC